MLTMWEAIQVRRSIRKFAPDDIPNEMIEQMLEAARLAPSAGNRQPWGFSVVRDKEVRRALRRICWDQPLIEEAPVVIVCFADLEQYFQVRRSASRYEKYLSSSDTSLISNKLTFAISNTYIAVEHLVLMATALGLGTCWVGGFDDASEFNRLFGLADNMIPVVVIPVGYSAEDIPPQRPRREMEDILIEPPVMPASERHEEDSR
jgi:nitroreductase